MEAANSGTLVPTETTVTAMTRSDSLQNLQPKLVAPFTNNSEPAQRPNASDHQIITTI